MSSALPSVLLVVHLMIAAALVGIVLMQRSEGGALGIGGGGGFMSGRGTANLLTRATAWLAAAFFATSLLLSVLASQVNRGGSVFDAPAATPAPAGSAAPAAPGTAPADGQPARGGILDKLQTAPGAPAPRVPQSQ